MRRALVPVWLMLAGLLCVGVGCEAGECASTGDCPRDQACIAQRCVASLREPKPAHVDRTDGWNDAPGSGIAFVMDTLSIAQQGRGFDLDDSCRGPGDCIDNAMWQLGQLGNDQIRQGLLGGETLALVEIAGIDEPFYGDDENVTLKWYAARDGDDPFFPANNFQIPVGETKCCEFLLRPESIDAGGRQARNRLRGRIVRGRFETVEPGPMEFSVIGGGNSTSDSEDQEWRWSLAFQRARLTFSLATDETRILDGTFGGVIGISSLAQLSNPYCKTLNQLCPQQLPDSTMIDLVGSIIQPDIDADGQPGFDKVELGASGRVQYCLDEGREVVPAMSSDAPWSCALRPEMGDGYSLAATFTGVRATVLGISGR